MFERPSTLATIGESALYRCESMTSVVIPVSVTVIDGQAFEGSRIRWIEVEEGSVSFRVVNDLLVDFEARSVVWVIGSPEWILIPSSIEELRPRCCALKARLRTVEFESDSNLRSIGESAFVGCDSLESICIPSSVEVLHRNCFGFCRSLRTVRFEEESKLGVIEGNPFDGCPSVELVSLPASFRVVNDLLVDSEVRSVICVIGSPESIVIPSSIEELRPFCCSSKTALATVGFQSDSNLRSIGRFSGGG
jgi:hypothetical protein